MDSIKSVRIGNTAILPINSIVALIEKVQQHPTWRKDGHQSGGTQKNTLSCNDFLVASQAGEQHEGTSGKYNSKNANHEYVNPSISKC